MIKFNLNKDIFLEKINIASRFTSNRTINLSSLQGILLKTNKNKLEIYSTNLSSFFATKMDITQRDGDEKEISAVIETKKMTEFVGLLSPGMITLLVSKTELIITSGKVKGSFALISDKDFPEQPKVEAKEERKKINPSLFIEKLPLVFFSSASDETRPGLTGVNFLSKDELTMVATDGFRLSLLKTEGDINIPSIIVPSEFLIEVSRNIKKEDDVFFSYSKEEKNILIEVNEMFFYSRIIDDEFPPFEKVIPGETKTEVSLDREEFIRNIKLISVFARELSNIVIAKFSQGKLYLSPKEGIGKENNKVEQDINLKGEEQTVAFNYRFLLDFLSHITAKEVSIEILRPDAPVVFSTKKNKGFIHIIMPVRLQQ